MDDDAEPNADLWAAVHESREQREQIVALHHQRRGHSDPAIDTLPLDTSGQVPWWLMVSVGLLVVVEAKPGKEDEVESFSRGARPAAA